jgi:hypothetical protein
MAEGDGGDVVWCLTFSTSSGKARFNKVGPSSHSRPRLHASMGDASRYLSPTISNHCPSRLHHRSPSILQARCRKSKRASPSARSGGTRARRTRRRPPSARRDRLVRPCQPASLLLHSPAPDVLRTNPAARGPGKMLPSHARSDPTRRPIWSRGGTPRRSRRCLATLGMENPCRRCQRCPPSTERRARREKDGRLEAPMDGCCRLTHEH